MPPISTLLAPSPTAQKLWILLNILLLGALFYNRLPFLWQLTLAALWLTFSILLYYKEITLQHPKSLLALELNYDTLLLHLKSGDKIEAILGKKTFLSRFYVILHCRGDDQTSSLRSDTPELYTEKRMIWADSVSKETWHLWLFHFKKMLNRL
jgi:hypothetical protein